MSGEIPDNISDLTEIEVLRLEVNYFDGEIPESVCELENVNFNDYLSFDFSYNQLCPPYPACIPDNAVEYMDTSECEGCCYEAFLANENCDGGGCFIPQCTENCEWEPMQCWGSTGYCWCVDENGIEIEGTSQPSWEGSPDCEGIDIGSTLIFHMIILQFKKELMLHLMVIQSWFTQAPIMVQLILKEKI